MATHATLNQSPNHRILVISVHAPSLLNLSISSYLIHLDIHRVTACKCHTVTGFNQVPGRAPLQPCNLPRLLFDFLGWYYMVLSCIFSNSLRKNLRLLAHLPRLEPCGTTGRSRHRRPAVMSTTASKHRPRSSVSTKRSLDLGREFGVSQTQNISDCFKDELGARLAS